MIYKWKLLLALFMQAQVGIATTFSANDVSNPNPLLYCTNRTLNDERDLIVAHPTLPCGSEVYLYNLRTKRHVVAKVADRGPRRALIDLSPKTARKLRANGMEPMLVVPLY
jgi:rare lipoprotein A (peptidoglycan hydrolase)